MWLRAGRSKGKRVVKRHFSNVCLLLSGRPIWSDVCCCMFHLGTFKGLHLTAPQPYLQTRRQGSTIVELVPCLKKGFYVLVLSLPVAARDVSRAENSQPTACTAFFSGWMPCLAVIAYVVCLFEIAHRTGSRDCNFIKMLVHYDHSRWN